MLPSEILQVKESKLTGERSDIGTMLGSQFEGGWSRRREGDGCLEEWLSPAAPFRLTLLLLYFFKFFFFSVFLLFFFLLSFSVAVSSSGIVVGLSVVVVNLDFGRIVCLKSVHRGLPFLATFSRGDSSSLVALS